MGCHRRARKHRRAGGVLIVPWPSGGIIEKKGYVHSAGRRLDHCEARLRVADSSGDDVVLLLCSLELASFGRVVGEPFVDVVSLTGVGPVFLLALRA